MKTIKKHTSILVVLVLLIISLKATATVNYSISTTNNTNSTITFTETEYSTDHANEYHFVAYYVNNVFQRNVLLTSVTATTYTANIVYNFGGVAEHKFIYFRKSTSDPVGALTLAPSGPVWNVVVLATVKDVDLANGFTAEDLDYRVIFEIENIDGSTTYLDNSKYNYRFRIMNSVQIFSPPSTVYTEKLVNKSRECVLFYSAGSTLALTTLANNLNNYKYFSSETIRKNSIGNTTRKSMISACGSTHAKLSNSDIEESDLLLEENKITIAPNPVEEILNIYASYTDEAIDLKVFDLSGKELISKKYENISGGKIELAVSNLNAGLYLVAIHQGDKIYQQKFMKQ